MNMEEIKIKSAEELAQEQADRETKVREAREKIAAGNASEEDKLIVARYDQLLGQAGKQD